MTASAKLAPPTVLVVDDYADTRAMFRRLMESLGYAVAEAVDGEAAVEVARAVCPDLVLLDLNMPLMDGLEAAQRIRELKEECAGVPIIAVTAYDTYGIKEAALGAGCDAYLTKPVELGELEREVSRLMHGR
jgi:two-component system, cell cycle response regulator DivK